MPRQQVLHRFHHWLQRVHGFSDDDCALFRPHLQVHEMPGRTAWLMPGSVCRSIAFVHRGALRMYHPANGREVNTAFFFADDFAADHASFLHGRPARHGIETLSGCTLITFGHEALRQAYDRSHRWERFGRLMAEQAYLQTTTRIEELLHMSAEERYKALLAARPGILNEVPLYHLAAYLGVERETLSRIRRRIARGEA